MSNQQLKSLLAGNGGGGRDAGHVVDLGADGVAAVDHDQIALDHVEAEDVAREAVLLLGLVAAMMRDQEVAVDPELGMVLIKVITVHFRFDFVIATARGGTPGGYPGVEAASASTLTASAAGRYSQEAVPSLLGDDRDSDNYDIYDFTDFFQNLLCNKYLPAVLAASSAAPTVVIFLLMYYLHPRFDSHY